MFQRAFNQLEEGLIAVFLGVMTLLTFVQVVLRYVFNSGFIWSLEATTYAFTWMVLLGMSYGVRTGSHIAVDLVARALPPGPRKIMGLLAVALCLVYAGLMAYGGYNLVDRLMTLGHNARDIPLPRWLLISILPFGFALLGVRLLALGRDIYSGGRFTLGVSNDEVKLGGDGRRS